MRVKTGDFAGWRTGKFFSFRYGEMDKIFEQTLLYDFYGELLTEHQKSVYEDAVCNDLSLSEIAQEQGVSRQAVHDLIRRCDKILENYEEKLHLVERFVSMKEKIKDIETLTTAETPENMAKIKKLALEILEEL